MTGKAIAGSETKPERRMRADALRNRDKLVAVAADVFADHGVEGSLEEVARRAGVGIGTLYRHFPTREHLVEVVYRRELQNLATAASDLAATRPADQALEEWMHRFVNYIAAKRGMAQSLRILLNCNSELFAESAGIISGALRQLMENAAAKGMIRSDVESTDLLHALSSIYSMPDSPEWRERSRRLIRLLMDGLKWGVKMRPAD